MVGCNVLLLDKGGSTTPMQGADLSYGGASSCHGYYLYTLFCSPPQRISSNLIILCTVSVYAVCLTWIRALFLIWLYSVLTCGARYMSNRRLSCKKQHNHILHFLCVCVRSYYATAGAHTLLWRMCSVTSGVGSSFSLLATLESEEATSTSWTQFWSLLIYVSLFFLVLNKCIKVRYNVWAFHSASESSEIYSPLSSEDSQFWFLGSYPLVLWTSKASW